MIRITSVELEDFKNTSYGKAVLSSWEPGKPVSGSDVVGVYGQNGSGKTSVVAALGIIKKIIMGRALSENDAECITEGKCSATITLHGVLFEDSGRVRSSFIYLVTLFLTSDGGLYIAEERLSVKDYQTDKPRMRTLFDCTVAKSGSFSLMPASRWKSLGAMDSALRTDLLVAQGIAFSNRSSLLFSREMGRVIRNMDEAVRSDEGGLSASAKKAVSEILEPLDLAVSELRIFALTRLAVVTTSRQAHGMINDLHISTHEGEFGIFADPGFKVDISKPVLMNDAKHELLKKTIGNINPVLGALVPGMTLGVKELGAVLMEDGAEGVKIEITCSRGAATVPLRCESEGIKKLVSILTLLIDVYGKRDACVVIDEFDNGIFEFLLGEILQVLQEHGKGQLVFTAHNLRPLEVLGSGSLLFTTTNPTNRYVKFKGNREASNLRNSYLRAINLGGQPETVYAPTSKFTIDGAFHDAAFPVEEG